MGLAQELQQIVQLQLLNDNIDDLETANANIYLDSGDINVAQTTLEMLIGGQANVLDTESPHYKSNYIWGTNELLTSIKTSLGTIDDTIDTTPGQEKLKVDIVSATATLDVNTDDLESKVLGITGSNPDFSNLFEVKTSIDNLRGTSTNISTLYDLKQSVDTLATETTIDAVNTNLDNLIYTNGSGYYIQAKDYNVLTSGSDAPENTPFTAIGGVDVNDKSRVLKTTITGDLNAQLVTGTDSIGTIGLDIGTNSIGTVGLDIGTNSIGKVGLNGGSQSIGTVGLNVGTNSVGTVGLNSGSNAIGTVEVTSAPTTAVTNDALTELNYGLTSLSQDTLKVYGTDTNRWGLFVHSPTFSKLGDAINSDKLDVNVTNASVAITHDALTELGTSIGKTNANEFDVNITNSNVAITHDALTELGGAIGTSQANQLDVNIKNSTVEVNGGTNGIEIRQNTANDLKMTEAKSADIETATIAIRGTTPNFKTLYDLDTSVGNIKGSGVNVSNLYSVNASVGLIRGTGASVSDLYTIKGVLDSIEANTDTLEVKVEAVNVNTDTLETKVQATNDALTTASTGTNALLTSVKTAVEKIDDAIDGVEMQVDVKTMPTTAVTGTFWQSTQDVSGSVTASTELNTADLDTDTGTDTQAIVGLAIAEDGGSELVGSANPLPIAGAVTGAFYPATQEVSGSVSVSGTVTANTEINSADLDTGAGSDSQAIVGLAIAESGGSELVGSANPLPVSGAFYPGTQPVSGTVTSNVTFPTSQTVDGGDDGIEIKQATASDLKMTEVNSSNIKTSTDTVGSNVTDLKGAIGSQSTLYDLDQELGSIKGYEQTIAQHSPKITDIDSTLTSHSANLDNIESHNLNSKNSLSEVNTAVAVSSAFKNGTETIGTTVGAITSVSHACNKGVTLSVEFSNLGIIYVGYDSSVDSSNGFPLEAGDSMYIPIDNPTKIYCIASIASQKVYWLAI